MHQFLRSTGIIDWETPEVLKKAADLSKDLAKRADIVRACFEFVRDGILHSSDYGMNPVTLRASDVLRHKTGFCYAKSHLLAALLRANGIPAGICYQRISREEPAGAFCLHALNAVHLDGHGWYRMDARGKKEGRRSEFMPPEEIVPYRADRPGEANLPEIWSDPIPPVVESLSKHRDYQELLADLPDIILRNA